MIAEALAGKRIAITGSTGFVGTALVERLLRSVPGCELVLLIRGGKRGAAERARRDIFKNDCFDRLRREIKAVGAEGFDEMVARRVQAINGDVGTDGLGLNAEDQAVLASCDVVIHSAAAVAFDSPLDSAIEINLLGPTRVAQALQALNVTPHLVTVSTCYVAGNRRGSAPEELVSEGPFDLGINWRKEVESGRRLRPDAEAASRTPEVLKKLRSDARKELGAAGAPALAAKTEQLRERWVTDELVRAGRARAASVGWPDAYAFTKALGEQALMETKGNIPVNIVRPSIIESSLEEPRPGWIRGFRMAEPVILSLARGLLTQFPGVPEGNIDVIPVDLVVASIIAVAATGPSAPRITQVASGGINPLKYRTMVDHIREWFTEHPLYDSEGQPIEVPEWTYPARGKVHQQLKRAQRGITAAEQALQMLPLRGRQATWAAKLEERKLEIDRATEYVELYGLYTECEAVYEVGHLMSMWDAASDEDHAAFNFDPRSIDWPHYVRDIHLPSIVAHARAKTHPGKKTTDRSERLRRSVLSPERHLAAFDLENTLISSNVVESYSWLATRRLNAPERIRYVLRTLAQAPGLSAMDRKDRGDFLRFFYRRYEDAPVDQIDEDSKEMLTQLIVTKSFPAGIRRVREHKAAGHRTLLITGAMDFAVAGLKPLFDEIVAAEMGVRADGTYTGELTQVPPTGETRAQVLADYCEAEGLLLEESIAYADSTSDLPMLECVGFPVAVNPETRLAAIARKRGWLVEDWHKASGGPRPLLPLGTLLSERERKRTFRGAVLTTKGRD
jgi:HAD superfamily hydrolase (TIGR01490 family)